VELTKEEVDMTKYTNETWFKLIKKLDPWFQRLSPTELQLSFLGYKCENYMIAQELLGGAVRNVKYDEQLGRTFVFVKEPKSIISGRSEK
jgi:hypothetical protein